jgi:hypothetical protein
MLRSAIPSNVASYISCADVSKTWRWADQPRATRWSLRTRALQRCCGIRGREGDLTCVGPRRGPGVDRATKIVEVDVEPTTPDFCSGEIN